MNPKKTNDYRDVAWLNETDYPLLINETERMWNILRNDFSIDRMKAWETSVYIFENRKLILKQNKDARCSPGFPCYDQAKKNLIRMERYWNSQAKGDHAARLKKNGLVLKTNQKAAITLSNEDLQKLSRDSLSKAKPQTAKTKE